MTSSIEQVMSDMESAFKPQAASGVDAVIQFRVSGEDGGDWYMVIKDQKCKFIKGMAEKPRVSLSANAQDTIDILSGKLEGTKAFFSGRLKVNGDVGFASKIATFFI